MTGRITCKEGCAVKCEFFDGTRHYSCPCINCLLKTVCAESCGIADQIWQEYWRIEYGKKFISWNK